MILLPQSKILFKDWFLFSSSFVVMWEKSTEKRANWRLNGERSKVEEVRICEIIHGSLQPITSCIFFYFNKINFEMSINNKTKSLQFIFCNVIKNNILIKILVLSEFQKCWCLQLQSLSPKHFKAPSWKLHPLQHHLHCPHWDQVGELEDWIPWMGWILLLWLGLLQHQPHQTHPMFQLRLLLKKHPNLWILWTLLKLKVVILLLKKIW